MGQIPAEHDVLKMMACAARRRWEFMLTIAPLRLLGATGSPVNPIAVF